MMLIGNKGYFNLFSIDLSFSDSFAYNLAMFTPAQCRAARGLIDWSQQQLADAAQVGVVTVRQFEAGNSQPRNATIDVMKRALEAAGVEFTNGGQPGVRMKASTTSIPPDELNASNDE